MTAAPLWRQIAETLTDEIAAGQYPGGARLPSEAALASRFGVNRHTVRRAIGDLADRGLVRARRGAGVFVAATDRTEYQIGERVRFHRQIRNAGKLPAKTLLSLETRLAAAEEYGALRIGASDRVHVYIGLSLADGVPIAHFRSVFPAARFADLPARLRASGSVTHSLMACGVDDYTRRFTKVQAVPAGAEIARHLQLRDGAPVLRTRGVNVDGDGVPVEYGITHFAGERVTLSLGDEDARGNVASRPTRIS